MSAFTLHQSTIPIDLLVSVLLWVPFRPNLHYLDFLQEGWRLEHENVHDRNSEYVIKGVVYNEMKGAFSEKSSVFGQNLLNNLMPDHTYGHVSGGNPLEIPKLTHENLKNFHSKYYHPSNARIFIYGNSETMNVNNSLNYISTNYLEKYNYINNTYSCIPNQKRWDKPRNVHISSRYDTMGAPFDVQNQITIAMLMNDIVNIKETFILSVLNELLVKGPNSLFYRNLIEPNFSGGYNQMTGFSADFKDTMFCVGLQDLKVEDFSRVQEIYDKTIAEAIEKGFDEKHVESILHNYELSLKHQTPQFGMNLLFQSASLWIHEGDIVSNLRVGEMIQNFRKELQNDPKLLQKKLEKYFTNNTHRLTLTMSPDDMYEENFKAAELNLLKQKIIALDHDKRTEIYECGLKLEQVQKAKVDLNILPCLSVEDVKNPPQPFQSSVDDVQGTPTQVCPVQTNGITYFKCLFDANNLTRDEILEMPLFCNLIDEMGTKNYDYRTFDKLVNSKCGGIGFRVHFAENIHDTKTYELGILMTTHGLDKNCKDMLELCNELLSNYKMDDLERAQMLINNYISNISVGIARSGHHYAIKSCSGLIMDSSKLRATMDGIEHIEYMKEYTKKHSTEQILKRMQSLGRKIFDRSLMRAAINNSEDFYPVFLESYRRFLSKMPMNMNDTNNPQIKRKISLLKPSYQHFVMNIPVNYCAKAQLAVPYTHPHHPALRILANYLSAKYLLPVVREQNGAYGSGARIGSDGIFSFYSYRDPHSVKTLKAFDDVYKWLLENESILDAQALFEAKLGVLQQLDSPIAPGNGGIDNFLYAVTPEMFLNYRKRMLSVTIPELKSIAEKYFKEPPKYHGKCILGPENKDLGKETNLEWKVINEKAK